MKKTLLAFTAFLLSFGAFAIEPSVKITSYTYINQEGKTAELCGLVSNMDKVPTYVQVTVDYNSNRPAYYNAFVGANGRFCIVVATYYGTATAKVF